ncbi:MAG: glycosyl hydrolase-related protein [Verrucomicrobia bacterium]|jgi:mannosylglycerate hydrolase|nr:glycosyl hydrolase-related protein [Verrucomicrobiota bacterium]
MQKEPAIGYVVPHTHWDREWRYPLWQNRVLLVRFLDQLLDVLETQPDYRSFVLDGQAVIIDDYLEVRPENRARIERQVRAGRLSIGPWFTLPDLYPVADECLVRNLLKGIRACAPLGGHLQVGYNSFGWGQTAQFPQIYAGFGINFIIAAKHISKARAPRCEFLWEAPDGTRVLTTRLGQHARANFFMNAVLPVLFGMDYLGPDYRYAWPRAGTAFHLAGAAEAHKDYFKLAETGAIHPERLGEAVAAAWEAMSDTTVPGHRLLMNGSDFSGAQPRLGELLRLANAQLEDQRLVHATLEEYIAVLEAHVDRDQLPVVQGEMRDGPAPSCSSNALATRPAIKRLNKRVQNTLLYTAEPLSVMATLAGAEYPRAVLDLGLRHMLLAHAHDSINGVTQDKTVRDVLSRLDQALEIGEVLAADACAELVRRMDTGPGAPDEVLLVLFNPLPHPRREVVKVCLDTPQEQRIWDFEVVDAEGHPAALQFHSRQEHVVPVQEISARPWPFAVDRHTVFLDTGELPPCGYALYRVVPRKRFNREGLFWPETRTSRGDEISRAAGALENEFLEARVNPDGTLALRDKVSGRVYPRLNYLEDSGDCGDYWVHYPPYENRIFTSLGARARIWTEENGPLSATVAAEVTLRLPVRADRPERGVQGPSRRVADERDLTFSVRYTLRRGARRVEVRLRLDNTVEDHRLRVLFDTGLQAACSHAAGHFTVDARPVQPVRDESGEYHPEMQTLPMQGFVDLSDGAHGLAVVSNCFSEFEARDNREGTLAITLLRGVRNIICTEFRSAGVFPHEPGGQSLGVHEFDYALLPHAGGWSEAGLYGETGRFNVPVIAVQTSPHAGSLPHRLAFLEVQPDGVVVTALKQAEDRDSFILRLFNPGGASVTAVLRLTVPIREAFLTNLNEDRLEPLAVQDGCTVGTPVGPNKIVTLELLPATPCEDHCA